ncbi:MAG: RNA methyltransferase substrate-binding domain-containing protein [Acidobacteriota bacterium]
MTERGLALAEGPHLLDEAVRSGCDIDCVIVAESSRYATPPSSVRMMRVTDAVFAKLASTESPQGVLALVRPPTWSLADVLKGKTLAVILDGIQDPGNAGAILRAARGVRGNGGNFLERLSQSVQSEVSARVGWERFSAAADHRSYGGRLAR